MIMTLNEYYKEHYLPLHQNKYNRRLHVLGQLLTILFVAYCLFTGSLFLLLLAPLVVYPFAWSGHFFLEKNRPAAWSSPLYAKASDWLMLRDVLTGKLEW
jgi:hypothetical protein